MTKKNILLLTTMLSIVVIGCNPISKQQKVDQRYLWDAENIAYKNTTDDELLYKRVKGTTGIIGQFNLRYETSANSSQSYTWNFDDTTKDGFGNCFYYQYSVYNGTVSQSRKNYYYKLYTKNGEYFFDVSESKKGINGTDHKTYKYSVSNNGFYEELITD